MVRKFSELQRAQMSRLIGAVRWGQTWFKQIDTQATLYATRRLDEAASTLRQFRGEAGTSRLDLQTGMYDAVQRAQNQPLPGTYEWAKAHAHESATAYVGLNLHRPSSTLNHRTAHFAGKPYHWRQDYTGQLKLAAGESPW